MDALLLAVENGDHDQVASLLAHVTNSEDFGRSLHVACGHDQGKCLQQLLASNAAVDWAITDGSTPLHEACVNGHGDCARLLLAANATVDQVNSDGDTALILSTCADDDCGGECAQLLLAANANVDQANSDGDTALHIACMRGSGECVQHLLAANAIVDPNNSDGTTPLILACANGHVDCVKLLLAFTAHGAPHCDYGRALNSACIDGHGETPMAAACYEGHSECTQLLLAANHAVDQTNGHGDTPLLIAVSGCHSDCAAMLLNANAAVEQRNSNGNTSLLIACDKGRSDLVLLLLAANAAVEQASSNGSTPLITACHNGHSECAQLLLTANAAVDQKNSNGNTSLLIACEKGHGECTKLLLTANASVDMADANGLTALRLACKANRLEAVKLLMQAGARTDLRAHDGWTALDVAESKGHTAIMRFLRSSRRAPTRGSAALPIMSAEDKEVAEQAAEATAQALLAEEEAGAEDPKQKASRPKKKSSQKAKSLQEGCMQGGVSGLRRAAPGEAGGSAKLDAGAADDAAAVADVSVAARDDAGAAASVAADEALRAAIAAVQYEGIARALEEHCAVASESVLADARALRDTLHKRRKKESQKLRRAHAVEMQTSGLASLKLEESMPPPPIASAGPATAAAVALTLAELTEATGGFGERKLIGSGGFGRVFAADSLPSLPPEALPPRLRHLPVAVKRAKSGTHDLANLQREVSVLQLCSHPHVLPLLGYYLAYEEPCLVFPLMRGGSFADRLFPSEADPEQLRRLGLPTPLRPLRWRERLYILRQAADALLYLHTPVPGGKGAVVHRDFKPENILLDEELNAYLADTGFAKMDTGAAAGGPQKSATQNLYLTRGYLDPSVIEGGDYTAATDGWALGITMLVALTSRSPLSIINKCEEVTRRASH